MALELKQLLVLLSVGMIIGAMFAILVVGFAPSANYYLRLGAATTLGIMFVVRVIKA